MPRIDISVSTYRRKTKTGKIVQVRTHQRNVRVSQRYLERIVRRPNKDRPYPIAEIPEEKITSDIIRANLRKDTVTVKTEFRDKQGNVLGEGDRSYYLQGEGTSLTLRKIKKD